MALQLPFFMLFILCKLQLIIMWSAFWGRSARREKGSKPMAVDGVIINCSMIDDQNKRLEEEMRLMEQERVKMLEAYDLFLNILKQKFDEFERLENVIFDSPPVQSFLASMANQISQFLPVGTQFSITQNTLSKLKTQPDFYEVRDGIIKIIRLGSYERVIRIEIPTIKATQANTVLTLTKLKEKFPNIGEELFSSLENIEKLIKEQNINRVDLVNDEIQVTLALLEEQLNSIFVVNTEFTHVRNHYLGEIRHWCRVSGPVSVKIDPRGEVDIVIPTVQASEEVTSLSLDRLAEILKANV